MKIYLVGGAVRDKLLGLPVTEHDYVVVGATVGQMLALGYKQVGKEFPVFLHPKTSDEYALARMERKVKPGYKGFEFDTSPQVSLEEDLQRRDLTINAMAYDLETKRIIDPFGGKQDLQDRILRHVSDAFIEDPVRILRVGRFLARYSDLGFHVDLHTMSLMQAMVARGEVDALVAERVWKELERALSEKNPQKFFEVLEQSHALPILFPGLLPSGLYALQSATQLTAKTPIRFATLLHQYGASTEKQDVKQAISHLCNRYRVPNYYRELATITALHHESALQAKELSVDELLRLFSAIDIYRREKRFADFLLACQAIAIAYNKDFDSQWLSQAARVVKDINVQALIKNGFDGAELANELKKIRHLKLTQWLTQS